MLCPFNRERFVLLFQFRSFSAVTYNQPEQNQTDRASETMQILGRRSDVQSSLTIIPEMARATKATSARLIPAKEATHHAVDDEQVPACAHHLGVSFLFSSSHIVEQATIRRWLQEVDG